MEIVCDWNRTHVKGRDFPTSLAAIAVVFDNTLDG